MKITEKDIRILTGSADIVKINKREDVEVLYSLQDEMELKGWIIDVWNYDCEGHLVVGLPRFADERITDSLSDRNKFITDLIECIDNILLNK